MSYLDFLAMWCGIPSLCLQEGMSLFWHAWLLEGWFRRGIQVTHIWCGSGGKCQRNWRQDSCASSQWIAIDCLWVIICYRPQKCICIWDCIKATLGTLDLNKFSGGLKNVSKSTVEETGLNFAGFSEGDLQPYFRSKSRIVNHAWCWWQAKCKLKHDLSPGTLPLIDSSHFGPESCILTHGDHGTSLILAQVHREGKPLHGECQFTPCWDSHCGRADWGCIFIKCWLEQGLYLRYKLFWQPSTSGCDFKWSGEWIQQVLERNTLWI
jgi:hypothetical protein